MAITTRSSIKVKPACGQGGPYSTVSKIVLRRSPDGKIYITITFVTPFTIAPLHCRTVPANGVLRTRRRRSAAAEGRCRGRAGIGGCAVTVDTEPAGDRAHLDGGRIGVSGARDRVIG